MLWASDHLELVEHLFLALFIFFFQYLINLSIQKPIQKYSYVMYF